MKRVIAIVFIATAAGACMAPGGSERASAPGEGALITVTDHAGQPSPLWAVPRSPRIVVDLPVAQPPGEALWLLRGAADEDMLQDASDAPLRKASLQRAVEVTWTQQAEGWVMEPAAPLAGDEVYTLLVAAWAVVASEATQLPSALPWAIELRASGDATDGAAIRHAWPADASPAVPTNLARVLVTLDGQVITDGEPPFELREVAGTRVETEVLDVTCESIDSHADHCIEMVLEDVLRPQSDYRISLSPRARDGRGAPLPPWSSSFRTSAGPVLAAPRLAGSQCEPDETFDQDVCVFADDMGVRLRLRTLEPALLRMRTGELIDAVVAPRGEGTFAIRGLPAQRAIDVRIEIEGAAGHAVEWHRQVHTSVPLPTLAVTEVRSDPRGPEPKQEYVELLNFGGSAESLAGFTLADGVDRMGSAITDPVEVAAGTRVLLVADTFDPESPLDGPIPAGVPLIRVGASLGQSGLSNTGEPLYLRDPAGRRISAAPALRTGVGGCLQRTATDPRTGDAGAFAVLAEAACTPGR